MGPQHHCQTTKTPVFCPKKFLLNITGAYNTTPTAALQVIEGLMPLHIKAKMQSTLVRVGRLGRNCDYQDIYFDHESYEQPSPPSTIHPALFSLEDRVSQGGQGPANRTPIKVYTDGLKINDQTAVLSVPLQTKPSLKPGKPS
ncbi:hypothetical protein AVEN_13007-1 [Araneus ventricosus]|uniref:Uncharacterized protein n=1 Tax=Araneus ventricosus TaxID=182803 RepID=A0A4Y2HMH2_ARAVE|nr:hypothetical protein AVEN_13007-1 [Araneus ventricosus]